MHSKPNQTQLVLLGKSKKESTAGFNKMKLLNSNKMCLEECIALLKLPVSSVPHRSGKIEPAFHRLENQQLQFYCFKAGRFARWAGWEIFLPLDSHRLDMVVISVTNTVFTVKSGYSWKKNRVYIHILDVLAGNKTEQNLQLLRKALQRESENHT